MQVGSLEAEKGMESAIRNAGHVNRKAGVVVFAAVISSGLPHLPPAL